MTVAPIIRAMLLAASFSWGLVAQTPAPPSGGIPGSGSFPSVNEVLEGRVFPSKTERDVYFLRRIHDRYPASWPALVEANITVDEYVWSASKLQRFVDELGTAMEGNNDLVASTNLARITSERAFYANTNSYRHEVVRSAALALIKIGPKGRHALAGSFTTEHYQAHHDSLEEIASVIGTVRVPDSVLVEALVATAFTLSAGDGATYPSCTRSAVTNLLSLPGGTSLVRTNLDPTKVFEDVGRYQSIVDGIAAAHATELATNLVQLDNSVTSKLGTLANIPGTYRDELVELQNRIRGALAILVEARSKDAKSRLERDL
jgi:hypothetical protein